MPKSKYQKPLLAQTIRLWMLTKIPETQMTDVTVPQNYNHLYHRDQVIGQLLYEIVFENTLIT